MTDWLSVMERGLKAVRYGIFRANDNLAYLLEGLCCAPEESKDNCGSCGRPKDAAHRPDCRNPDAREFAFDDVPTVHLPDSAASPQVADDPAGGDLAPTPEAGATSLPGHPLSTEEIAAVRHLLANYASAVSMFHPK